MPRVGHCGYLLPGDSRAADLAGYQCTAPDPDEDRGRCRMGVTHIHRRRDGNRVRVSALCPKHYEQAGPEAAARR
ncbi:MAG: hypothetical protein ACRDRU_27365 [Pseudonocardiaceae bacterium]